MRLLLTVVVPEEHRAADLAVDAEPGTTVGDLARTLVQHLGLAPAALTRSRGGLGLVADPGDPGRHVSATPAADVPPLFLDGVLLDPQQRLGASAVRHGAVLGIGGPLPQVLGEPHGVIEIRVCSGPGAGTVHRLGVGSLAIGTALDATVRLDEPGLPPVSVRAEVGPGGAVTVTPEESTLRQRHPAPARRRPLPGPVVVPREGEVVLPKQRWWRRYEDDPTIGLPHDVIDPADAVPLVHLDRRALDGPRPWRPGEALVIGATLLELAAVEPPDASLSPSPQGATSDYNRPPRMLPAPRVGKFTLPTEPRRPEKQPIPMLLVFVPIVMSLALFWFTKSPYSLIFAIFSPLMAIGNVTSSRRQGTKRYREELAEYRARTRKIRLEAYQALLGERSARRRDLPDPAALLLVATGPRARLWERRRGDPDWLQLRIGTADVPSEVTLRDPKREEHEGPLNWTTPDVPVAVDLAMAGVAGVAGPPALRRALGRWAVAQAAALHSPADLELVVLAGEDGDDDWSWVRWLPHARPPHDQGAVLARVGADDATIAARVGELVQTMQARLTLRENARTSTASNPGNPLLIVLDGARRLRLLPGMVSLLQDGPSVNMSFLCLDDDPRTLPEECRAVVSTGVDGLLELQVTGELPVEGVRPDVVPVAWCERVGRALAPVLDVSSEDLAGSLPASSRLLEVLGIDPPDAAVIAAGWRASGGRSTRAVIGEGADGPFTVDIRADGPHGLVAGTTGSGKSELLQTLIASLAVANRPDEMTFVLVDYKGGAAFKDCAHLPHTVGMVTDLDGHLTTRALESLGAELRRREHQLADAGAKDIEDYTAARTGGGAGSLVVGVRGAPAPRVTSSLPPMPRLMLIIDEFAALVAELPEFVAGLVDIARRGRSLGVHLLLATQRPAGVVSAEIKSNTALRIALRVTDPQDSQDVIETSDAAAIPRSLPGRAYARVGQASLMAFQSARVGGRPVGDGPARVGMRNVSWDSIGDLPPARIGVDQDDVSTPTDLARLVEEIGRAARADRIEVPPSPWLPALPDTLTLDDPLLAFSPLRDHASPREGDVAPIVFGLVDRPAQQRRDPAVLDLADAAHLAVIGAPRTGRSSVLRAIAGSIGRSCSPQDVHLYGIDCGNNALLPMLALPHTGAVVTRDQPDRLSRLTARVLGEVSRRQQLLAELGYADLSEQRAAAPEASRLPYLVVLLDRWEGFLSAFDSFDSGRLVDQWQQVLQEGAGVGVVVVLSSDRTALSGRLSTLADDKLVLRMTDPGDLTTIGLPLKQVPDHMPPGRGFRAEGLAETQVALLDVDPSGTAQVAALQAIGRRAAEQYASVPASRRPFRVDQLPTRITLADAAALAGRGAKEFELPIGVGGDTLALQYLDTLDQGPGFLIAGPRRSGRSTALGMIGGAALAAGRRVVVVTARTSPMRDFALRPGVLGSFTPEDDRVASTELVKSLAPTGGQPPSLLLVDDLEVLGADGWAAELITEHLGSLRDSGCAVVAAGTTDELGGVYRGPVVALKKSRSGVLLTPAAPNDGDVFGLRLPRAVLGSSVPGRGILVQAGAWSSTQIVLPHSL